MALLKTRAAHAVLAVLAGALLIPAPAASHVETADTAELRAALVLNFARFTTWPEEVLPPGDPLVIGVIGEASLLAPLEELALSEQVGGHGIEVRRLRSLDEATGLHVLYVCHDVPMPRRADFAGPPGAGVLVVGDAHDVLERGGIIEVEIEERARFRVNRQAAARAGLRLSSHLLRLAEPE